MISGRRPLNVYNCSALINGGEQRVERNADGHPEAYQLALLLEDLLVFIFNDQVAFINPSDERLTYRSTIIFPKAYHLPFSPTRAARLTLLASAISAFCTRLLKGRGMLNPAHSLENKACRRAC